MSEHEPASMQDCMKTLDILLNGDDDSKPDKIAFVLIMLPFGEDEIEDIKCAGNIPDYEIVRLIQHMASRAPSREH